MAQLPADRTKLTLAQQNQVPSFTAAATANINAITEAYDTIDLLNQKVDNYLANPNIPDGSITTPKLANSAVTTNKIANGAVTNQKIADGVITANKFVPGALTNETQNGLRITELEEEVAEHKAETVTDVANIETGYNADPTGAVNSTAAIQSAIDSDADVLYAPDGKYRHSGLLNKFGKEIIGPGKIIRNGQVYNSYAYRDKLVFGVNYLSAWHKKLMAGTTTKIVFSGDSTTAGGQTSGPEFHVNNLIALAAQKDGFTVTTVNNGVGSASTQNWADTHVTNDLANNPDLLVLRWGINDPYFGRTLEQFIDDLRSGLAIIRASRPLESLSIILMSPNSTYDPPNGRDSVWFESMVPAIKQAARDFQCCFIDTYAFLQDSENGSDWMDDPWDDGRHIHPRDVGNIWITSLMYDVMFPSVLRAKYGKRVGDPIAAVLQNGWINNNDALTSNAEYFKDVNGIVYVKGVIKSGTVAANTVLFNLPVGYRPAKDLFFVTACSGGTAVIIVKANGDVVLFSGGSATYTSLDGIVFKLGI